MSNKPENSQTTENKPVLKELTVSALAVLRGEKTGDDTAHSIKGAKNDYNAKGRGSTMARRVLRGGSWEWVSAPASRARFLAGDRKDIKYGDVFEGEVVAEYTLGGSKTADNMYLVRKPDEEGRVLATLDFTKIKTGYRINFIDGQTIEVSDPYWK